MISNIAKSIKKAYPTLSDEVVRILLDSLLKNIAVIIAKGKQEAWSEAFYREIGKNDAILDGYLDARSNLINARAPTTTIYSDNEAGLEVLEPVKWMAPILYSPPITIDSDNLNSDKYRLITLEISAPKLLTIDSFLSLTIQTVRSLDFIYFLLYFVAFGLGNEIKSLCEVIDRSTHKDSLQKADFYKVIKPTNDHSLGIKSIHYGSPITIDLLGIGNILQTIKEIFKDVSWRANHEKKLAELERKNKKIEIEKAKGEVSAQKLALERESTEIVLKKIEMLERLNNLSISNDEKQLIVSAMIPTLLTLVDNRPKLLPSKEPPSLTEGLG